MLQIGEWLQVAKLKQREDKGKVYRKTTAVEIRAMFMALVPHITLFASLGGGGVGWFRH